MLKDIFPNKTTRTWVWIGIIALVIIGVGGHAGEYIEMVGQ